MTSATLLAEADRRFNGEQWNAAAEALQELLRRGMETAAILLFLGIALYRMNRFAEAAPPLRRTVDLEPNNVRALLHLGVAIQNLGQHHEALRCLQKVSALEANHVEAFFFTGESLGALGRHDEAIAAFKQALTLHPSFFQALFKIGEMHRRAGRKDEARHYFMLSATMAPDSVDPAIALGNFAYHEETFTEAHKWYTKAISLAPDSALSHYNMGLTLHRLEERREGLQHLNRAIALGSDRDFPWGPARIRIEVSSCCNLRCRHCPTGISYQRVPRTVMSLGLFKALLDQLKQIHNVTECVLYLGGEPLLNPDLPLMVRLLREHTPVERIFFNTNGMLLTAEICKALAGSGLSYIEVSIDGQSPEENNAIRKGADYERIAANIHMLRQLAPELRVTLANTQLKRPGDPEVPRPAAFLRKEFPDLPIESHYAMHWPGLNLAESAMADATTTLSPAKRFCDKPFTELAVRANGDVVPCCYDLSSEMVLGNMADHSLLEIWRGESCRSMREAMITDDTGSLPALCRKCIIYTGALPVLPDSG